MIKRQSSTSCEYHEYGPYVTNSVVSGCDWAFTAVTEEPESGDWTAGDVVINPNDSTRFTFRILVSGDDPAGGTVQLPEGVYRVWIRPAVPLEATAKPVGELTIY
jgi:hypothetical protein